MDYTMKNYGSIESDIGTKPLLDETVAGEKADDDFDVETKEETVATPGHDKTSGQANEAEEPVKEEMTILVGTDECDQGSLKT